MNLLRWSRIAILGFAGCYLLALAALWAGLLTGLALWMVVISIAGAAVASVLALASQLAVLVKRRKHKSNG